jgi:hypothetical protein
MLTHYLNVMKWNSFLCVANAYVMRTRCKRVRVMARNKEQGMMKLNDEGILLRNRLCDQSFGHNTRQLKFQELINHKGFAYTVVYYCAVQSFVIV